MNTDGSNIPKIIAFISFGLLAGCGQNSKALPSGSGGGSEKPVEIPSFNSSKNRVLLSKSDGGSRGKYFEWLIKSSEANLTPRMLDKKDWPPSNWIKIDDVGAVIKTLNIKLPKDQCVEIKDIVSCHVGTTEKNGVQVRKTFVQFKNHCLILIRAFYK